MPFRIISFFALTQNSYWQPARLVQECRLLCGRSFNRYDLDPAAIGNPVLLHVSSGEAHNEVAKAQVMKETFKSDL